MMYQYDSLYAKDGSVIKITFFAHASISIEWDSKHIYVDPVGEMYDIDYSGCDKADIILITHHHKDHYDAKAISSLVKDDTIICMGGKPELKGSYLALPPFKMHRFNGIELYSVPAYNITESHLQYHPHTDCGLGYVLILGGTSIYVAGDTENNKDVLSLMNIDIAFLPVNQPYTMTIDQAVETIEHIRPSIFYPYHYGSSIGVTDVSPLVNILRNLCEVRIRNLK